MMQRYLLTSVVLILFSAASLSACGSASTNTSQTQMANVVLSDTSITANPTAFHPGMQWHFMVSNNGTVPHEFLIMPMGMAQMMGTMPMAQWRQQALHTSGMIGPGKMAEFDYTFPNMSMMQQGHGVDFGCYADGSPLMQMHVAVAP